MCERRIRLLVCVRVCRMFARDERRYLNARYVEMQNAFFSLQKDSSANILNMNDVVLEKSYNKRET